MARREIERKYRLPKKPRLSGVDAVTVRQGYLLTANGELRVREAGRKHFMTVKSGDDRDRNEWEKKIPRWVFDLLWPHTAGRRVEKKRYEWSLDGALASVDVYEGLHDGLVILEVEFESRKRAEGFRLPRRFSKAIDVTDDAAYKNRTLAVSEVPPWPA